MSVNQDHYVIYGTKFNYEDFKHLGDKLNEFEEKINDDSSNMILLVDGMNGEYVIFGKKLQKGEEYEGLELCSFSIEDLNLYEVEVKKAFVTYGLNQFLKENHKLIVLTHWH